MTEDERITKVNAAVKYLTLTAHQYLANPYRAICLMAIEKCQQGFGGAKHHHDYLGGLAVHTADVVRRCLDLSGATWTATFPDDSRGVDLDVLLTAAYWHDYEKLSDYVWKDGQIETMQYAKHIGHVVGSTYAFLQAARVMPAEPLTTFSQRDNLSKTDAILHCMLSHHGRKEWGSPIEPATSEAWILHAADVMSSRAKESTS